MDKMKFETPDLTAKNVEKIAALFPSCVTEMLDEEHSTPEKKVYKHAINFEQLKQMLSPNVVDGEECYEFTWVGKKAAMVEANKPIRKTLRPCKEESKNWDTTENLYIEGDNLEVLKLLQESYLGKVKMIYIDPPYNTGNDFIYADDFMRSQEEENEQMGMYDEDENRLFKNTDTNGRFHSDWCSMIYSRLMLARNLLTEDGVIFISIDDGEVSNLIKLCNDVFGEINFVADLIWQKKFSRANDATYFSTMHDHILCYCKSNVLNNENGWKIGLLPRGDEIPNGYSNPDNDPRGLWTSVILSAKSGSSSLLYEIETPSGRKVTPPSGRFWSCSKETFENWKADNRIWFGADGNGTPRKKTFLAEVQQGLRPNTILFQSDVGNNQEAKQETKSLFNGIGVFDGPKPVRLLSTLLRIANTDENSVILDFFSGSATTAHAVMQLNAEDGGHRKFIMVQLPEPCDEKSEAYKAGYKNICEIGKERIRRAGEKIKSEIDLTKNNDLEKMIESQQSEDKETMVAFGSTSSRGVLEKKDYTYKDTESGEMRYEDYSKKEAQNLYRFNPDALDVGFRVLKLDDTNMKDVYYAPDDYDQGMLAGLESNIKDDRTDLDLLFGCLIEWGLPLSLPYKSEKIDGCTVHTYNDGDLIACFDANIPESVVKEIAKRKPLRAVFRDSGFASSPEKINVLEIFKAYMSEDSNDIKDRVKVI